MPAATAPRVIIEPGQGEDPRLDGLVELVRDTTGRGPLLAASAAESAALARQILVVSRQDPADGGAGEEAGGPAAPAVLVLRRGAGPSPSDASGADPGPVVVADLEECLGPGGEGRLLGLLLSAQHPPLGRTVAVTGARGGIGATTVLLLLARALAAQGIETAAPEPNILTATTAPAARIGEIAAANGIVLHELATQRASLEDAYLELTGNSVEYTTGQPARPQPTGPRRPQPVQPVPAGHGARRA